MAEITLYLHIGATKTGSTALQRFLEQSQAKLLEMGVFYPNFHDKDIFSPMRPDYNYWQGRYFENSDGAGDLELLAQCIQYCKDNQLHSIVISHEAFLVNWPDRWGKLAGKLDANVKIICYVRRQDHYLEAAWKQWGHKFVAADQLFTSLDRPEWGGWRMMDWQKALTPWAENFGKENIILHPYEKEQLPHGILPDFLNKIGLEWPEKPSIKDGTSVNASFSRDVLEFLYFNREFYGSFRDHRIHNMLDDVLDDNFKKKVFDSYGILPPEDRIALLKKYEPANQSLAREYLGRADGCLFYEPWPDPKEPWEQYDGLTVEQFTPIVTKVLYTLYERQNALDRQYKALIQKQQLLIQQQQQMSQTSQTVLSVRTPKRILSKLLHFLHLKK